MNCCSVFRSCFRVDTLDSSAYTDTNKQADLVAKDPADEFIPLTKTQFDAKEGIISSELDYSSYFDGFIAGQAKWKEGIDENRNHHPGEDTEQFIESKEGCKATWVWETSYEFFLEAENSLNIPAAMEFRLRLEAESSEQTAKPEEVILYPADKV